MIWIRQIVSIIEALIFSRVILYFILILKTDEKCKQIKNNCVKRYITCTCLDIQKIIWIYSLFFLHQIFIQINLINWQKSLHHYKLLLRANQSARFLYQLTYSKVICVVFVTLEMFAARKKKYLYTSVLKTISYWF